MQAIPPLEPSYPGSLSSSLEPSAPGRESAAASPPLDEFGGLDHREPFGWAPSTDDGALVSNASIARGRSRRDRSNFAQPEATTDRNNNGYAPSRRPDIGLSTNTRAEPKNQVPESGSINLWGCWGPNRSYRSGAYGLIPNA